MAFYPTNIVSSGGTSDLKFMVRSPASTSYAQVSFPKSIIQKFKYVRVLEKTELSGVVGDFFLNRTTDMNKYLTTVKNLDLDNTSSSVTFSTTDILVSSLIVSATDVYYFENPTASSGAMYALYFHN